MSIMLGIKWADGSYDCRGRAGASQSTARFWAEVGRELGLELISQIADNGWPTFGPENLQQLITEFESLRKHIRKLDRTDATVSINQILEELETLNGMTGWEGDFG
jgi:hypothetical protein